MNKMRLTKRDIILWEPGKFCEIKHLELEREGKRYVWVKAAMEWVESQPDFEAMVFGDSNIGRLFSQILPAPSLMLQPLADGWAETPLWSIEDLEEWRDTLMGRVQADEPFLIDPLRVK